MFLSRFFVNGCMDFAFAGYFGVIFLSASASLWLLNREHQASLRRYRAFGERLGEVERVFSEVKVAERNLRRKMSKQAAVIYLEGKLSQAEKELLQIKARAS